MPAPPILGDKARIILKQGLTFIGFIVMGLTLFAIKWSVASEVVGPRIQFDTLEHDSGQVEEGDILECTFDFKNVGDAELIIERVVPS